MANGLLRAALEPAVYCYHCEFCRAGRHNICEHIRFLSTPPDAGFFREFLNLPCQNLLPLAPEIGFREGTLFEPLGVVLHSLKFVSLRPSEWGGEMRSVQPGEILRIEVSRDSSVLSRVRCAVPAFGLIWLTTNRPAPDTAR